MGYWDKPTLKLMEQTLDASVLRQKVVANNIANSDTPYFKRSEVKFEELLQREQNNLSIVGKRTDPRHIPFGGRSTSGVSPELVQDPNSRMNNNLNNVDIDYEMTLLAKNQLRYNVLMNQVNLDLKKYRTAISGGR